MDSSFPFPTIHLNGTGKKVLLSQHSTALHYLVMAINAFEETTCHPRDYYVHEDPNAWDKAAAKRAEIGKGLAEAMRYLETICYHLKQ